ncbi:GNAT family N-acetyltransferase [Bacillus sp. FSL R5-0560]|jgi:ribosomal protein S18 acetylase RimI-like enzyme|uniref:GNAT family N-acetyltransferase n=1 Tax=Bacillus TaxID=1386 RepID=UPI00227F9B31|nr:GNAT family N-acetyltransferase [Bacillus mojavensis]MCY9190505.1 GNAT family N-acetyltransferase [Bacillus mojavensis]MEC1679453.1 GNAT family N-acetyltransferase [Bacillus mojavensis]MEC1711431.1 GNAT family N-acetyltransferase [Bacillus mojavensis]
MALTLEDMTVEEFKAFRGMSVQNYAKQNIASGTWTEKEAIEKSEQAYEKMIPDGRNSSNHTFWNITNEQGERIGWLWLYADPLHPQKEAFIYSFGLYEAYRGKGLAQLALQTLDGRAREMGVERLALHVFAHNETAVHLYQKMGYIMTNIKMRRQLC